MPRLWFGKHRGRLVNECPTDYLKWMCRNFLAWPDGLKDAVYETLRSRGVEPPEPPPPRQPPPPPPSTTDWRAVLKAWFARLSLAYHPDRGGTDEQMRVVNRAREELERLLQGAAR
jgi:hypothetical protein